MYMNLYMTSLKEEEAQGQQSSLDLKARLNLGNTIQEAV